LRAGGSQWKKIVDLDERIKVFLKISVSLVHIPCLCLFLLSEKYGVDLKCQQDDLAGFWETENCKPEFLVEEAR
jgi:hypothetical protein